VSQESYTVHYPQHRQRQRPRIVPKLAIADSHTTVTFNEEANGKTTITVHRTFSFESDATRGAAQGWTITLDQLAAQVMGRNGKARIRSFSRRIVNGPRQALGLATAAVS
jgi:activator of Hsp90 ATPase-like protein